MSSRPKLRTEEVERLRLRFMQLEVTKEGKLTHEEFRLFLRESFPLASEQKIDEICPKKLGNEEDDRIDFDQYIDFMSQDVSLRFDVRFIRHQRAIWEDRCGLATYVPFLALFLYFLVTGKALGDSYWTQNAVMQHLKNDEFENSADLRYYKVWEDIGEVEEYWDWQSFPMLNTIWPDNGDDTQGGKPINGVNFPVGAMKLRQIRVAPRNCSEPVRRITANGNKQFSLDYQQRRYNDFGALCHSEFEDATVDKNPYPVQSYIDKSATNQFPQVVLMNDSYVRDEWERNVLLPAYKWRSAAQLNGSAAAFLLGKLTTYPPDGYAIEIPFSESRANVKRLFSALQNGITVQGWDDVSTSQNDQHAPIQIPWIDKATRAVSIEFMTYNQNHALICRYQMFLEITASGLLVPIHYVSTFQFFNLSGDPGFWVLFLIFVTMIFVQCFLWILKLRHGMTRYVLESGEGGIIIHLSGILHVLSTEFWIVFDFVNLGLFLVGLGLRIYWMFLGFTDTSVLVLDGYPKDWETIGEVQVYIDHVDAFNAFLSFLRIFYYLRLNTQLNLLTQTIEKAKAELMGIVFIFLIVFIGFALMAYVVFGTLLEGYRDFSTTISSLLRLLLGDFDYHELREEQRIYAPVIFAIFTIMANFLLLNMVIAVLNEAFHQVQVSKFQSTKMEVLLENVRNHEEVDTDPFLEKISRKSKGCQNWIRGTSLWRELVYSCSRINMYRTQRDELVGGDDEWEAKMREIVQYNPRKYWEKREEMMFYQKRSVPFTDKLNIVPMPLKFHLLEEFGDDLKYVIDLSGNSRTVPDGWPSADVSRHDLVIEPAYCTDKNPQQILLELMDYYHTWKGEIASEFADVVEEEDDEGAGEKSVKVIGTENFKPGIALRGSEEAGNLLDEQAEKWRAALKGKIITKSTDHTRTEKQRRIQERDEFEQIYERKQLEEQTQYISNLQHHLDEMHSTVAGKVQDGIHRMDAKDVLTPSTITITGASVELANGIYQRQGIKNGKPYWKKTRCPKRERNYCILWGDGRWWIGKPRIRPRDRVCVPALYTWEDTEARVPPEGRGADDELLACKWAAVGGIGNPPTLTLDGHEGGSNIWSLGGDCRSIIVEGATTHQVNGRYSLTPLEENGKSVWRKRYQVVCRYFKVEPVSDEAPKTSKVRQRLRNIRDEISDKFNVTLRVPGEPAARDRRMQLEGDWQMVENATKLIYQTARHAYKELRDHHGEDIDAPLPQDSDELILPEVFFLGGKEVLEEEDRMALVDASAEALANGNIGEYECVGKGYDLDIKWKDGRWAMQRRLIESSTGYIPFHETPPKVSLMICTKALKATKITDSIAYWEDFMRSIPQLMSRYADTSHLLSASQSFGDDDVAQGQDEQVHVAIKSRVPQPGSDDQANAPYFEDGASWSIDRMTNNADDALIFGATLEDNFPVNGTTSEVHMSGKLAGCWLECLVLDEPAQDDPTPKYRIAIDMISALGKCRNRVAQERLTELLSRSELSHSDKRKVLSVPRESLRKIDGQNAESWGNRLASWLNNPEHRIHKDHPGLLSCELVLNPSPQTLYACEDPDSRNHPPLFPTNWIRELNDEESEFESCDNDYITLVGTTKVNIKKTGLGGLDTEPKYLALHHAYTRSPWKYHGSEPAQVYSGDHVGKISVSSGSYNNGTIINAQPIVDVKGEEWLEQFNVQEGTSLQTWVKKANWRVERVERVDLPEQWCRDARDENSLYVCVHRWKNEASFWDIERAPERGTKMYIRKSVVESYKEELEGLKQVMTASNYPLSYKGDGKVRYLSVFDDDKRQKGDRTDRPAYWVSAHEGRNPPGEVDSALWEIALFPKQTKEINRNREVFWWRGDTSIWDWLKHDCRDDAGNPLGVPEIPKGTRWTAKSEPSKQTAYELASREELENRVTWYLNYWRMSRMNPMFDDVDGFDDENLSKANRFKSRTLKTIDSERENQSHKVLIRKVSSDTSKPPTYLSAWKNYPYDEFDGVWVTDLFLSDKTDEEHVLCVRQDGTLKSVSPANEVIWETNTAPVIGGREVEGIVYRKGPIASAGLTTVGGCKCVVKATSSTTMVLIVSAWKDFGVAYEFEFHRKDDFSRDDNSHFLTTTEEYHMETHTLWEIEPIHELDTSIDSAVKSAIVSQHDRLKGQFRDLIHEEMTFILKTVMPNVLLDELGPNQLVQTLNYKIRTESSAKEEFDRKGIASTDAGSDATPNPSPREMDTTRRVKNWQGGVSDQEGPQLATVDPICSDDSESSMGDIHSVAASTPAIKKVQHSDDDDESTIGDILEASTSFLPPQPAAGFSEDIGQVVDESGSDSSSSSSHRPLVSNQLSRTRPRNLLRPE